VRLLLETLSLAVQLGGSLYLVGTQVLLLHITVGVAVIRVVRGGPVQGALLLQEVTEGNVSGNLWEKKEEKSSISDCNSSWSGKNLCDRLQILI